jgi:hypothetical protein
VAGVAGGTSSPRYGNLVLGAFTRVAITDQSGVPSPVPASQPGAALNPYSQQDDSLF